MALFTGNRTILFLETKMPVLPLSTLKDEGSGMARKIVLWLSAHSDSRSLNHSLRRDGIGTVDLTVFLA